MEDAYTGFETWDIWAQVFFASLGLFFILLYIGRKVKPRENPVLDAFVDVLILVSASSAIATVITTPLVNSIITKLGFTSNEEANAGWAMLLGAVILSLGIWYVKKESWWILLVFGIALQIGAMTVPEINQVLSWWITGPVRWFYNALGDIWELFRQEL